VFLIVGNKATTSDVRDRLQKAAIHKVAAWLDEGKRSFSVLPLIESYGRSVEGESNLFPMLAKVLFAIPPIPIRAEFLKIFAFHGEMAGLLAGSCAFKAATEMS